METNVPNKNPNGEITDSITPGRRLPFLFLGLVIIGIIAHFVFNNHWIHISGYHVGALGVTGLFAYLTAYIANRKAYNFRKVFLLTFLLPIVLGIIISIIASLQVDFFYCGGGVVLAASVILVIIYSLLKKRSS